MASPPLRTVFVSDVHLGTPDCKAEYLLDFLRHVRCRQLYLVGDIIDLEALRQHPYWPATHAAVLGQLLRMARSGTEVIYIPGNHDAALRGLAGQCIGGIRIMRDALHIGADGRRFRVSHGDEFDPHHGGKRWLYQLGDTSQQLICWFNRRLNRWRRRRALPYLALTIIIKSRIARALAYIQQFEHLVAATAKEQGFDGHICGHIHFGGIRNIDGVLYCNDGDWVEHCTALTEDDSGYLELMHWTEQQTCLANARGDLVQPGAVSALAFGALPAVTSMQLGADRLRPAA
ncbi:MAG: UDP-2,3-diacylglucosamine diphosphatase [Xanthomonadaceae bacterium]|nr:UDP-2,3-diacylglucosamine diphosphatase [Xanthomonadaceae bacterium]MDP2184925.1 UDP-2,3-diacylglucosamine diphosphatase [Xanthomonadales bacterium]MDZ4115925.1 UDP-2,3-diacylglucosamine diphosphatase [Xanthomonadaceae bacterium]MDZ4378165.1 UDP-2,3-diacylglucosamine diphosphatase [Xanthomonadaceae bacterium]